VSQERRVQVFLAAQTLSSIGSWATLTALWGVSQYHFGVGAGGVTAVAIGWSMPTVLLFPIVGIVIDRVGPGRVLFAAELGSVAVLLAMIASTTFSQLVVLAALSGVAKAFLDPAMLALPPRLVGDADLPRLNGALRMTTFVGIVVGPAIGGFAIDRLGFDAAFAVDAASFGFGLLGLALLPQERLRSHLDAHRESTLRADVAEGWRIVRARPVLRRILVATTAVSTLYGSYIVLEPLYVKHVLGRSPSTYAWLQTMYGITLVAGAVYTLRHASRLARLRVSMTAAVCSAIAAAGYLGTRHIEVAYVAIAAWGISTAFFSTPTSTLLHRNAPGEAHGRVLACERMVDSTIKLTTTLTAGALAATIGIRPAAAIFVGLSLAVSLPVALSAWRAAPSPEPAVEPVPA
jgi:MFS family permease